MMADGHVQYYACGPVLSKPGHDKSVHTAKPEEKPMGISSETYARLLPQGVAHRNVFRTPAGHRVQVSTFPVQSDESLSSESAGRNVRY